MIIWWHNRILKHTLTVSFVTVSLGDFSRGHLIDCSCGKGWAR